MLNKKSSFIQGTIIIAIAIIMGAFAAHALKEVLSPEKLDSFKTGVRYQTYHGFALLILPLLQAYCSKSLKTIQVLFLVGTTLFSGSIYVLSIQEILGMSLKFLGPVTPIGGALLIFAWILLSLKLYKNYQS